MRQHYHEELDDINTCLVEMANSVGSAMSKATTALLDADIELANMVIEGDERIDATRESIEQRCFTLLARQAPVATDLRTITAAMRIISDLERMGDLAVHVAKLARMRFPEHTVPQELRPIFLEAEDDLMDQLHRQLFSELLSKDWPHGMEAAIDITLLGRYYERFADHAVSVARRVVYLVTGEREMHATAN